MCDSHKQFAALSKDDQRLLDALVESGFDARALEPLTDDERKRVNAIMQVFAGFDEYPADDGGKANREESSLIDATMARIDRYETYRRAPAEAVLRNSRSRLSSADQQLLDALVDVNFDLSRIGPLDPAQHRRAEAMVSLFELLDDYPVDDGDEQLIELVMERLEQIEVGPPGQTRETAQAEHIAAARVMLADEDARLLDILIAHNFDRRAIEGLTDIERRRVERLSALFTLLESYPVEQGDASLIDAAMARVQQHDSRLARLEAAMRSEARPHGRRRRRLPDFISAAAIILLCASVLWPMWDHVRTGPAPSHHVEIAGDSMPGLTDGRYGSNATAGMTVANPPWNGREVTSVHRALDASDVYLFVVRMPDGRFKVYQVRIPLERKPLRHFAE